MCSTAQQSTAKIGKAQECVCVFRPFSTLPLLHSVYTSSVAKAGKHQRVVSPSLFCFFATQKIVWLKFACLALAPIKLIISRRRILHNLLQYFVVKYHLFCKSIGYFHSLPPRVFSTKINGCFIIYSIVL